LVWHQKDFYPAPKLTFLFLYIYNRVSSFYNGYICSSIPFKSLYYSHLYPSNEFPTRICTILPGRSAKGRDRVRSHFMYGACCCSCFWLEPLFNNKKIFFCFIDVSMLPLFLLYLLYFIKVPYYSFRSP